MSAYRLPGPCCWFYEKTVLDCLCVLILASRKPAMIGDEIFCFAHQRMAKVERVLPATLAEQDALCQPASEPESEVA